MEDKFVINIGRQLGSGGKAVAEELARRLDIRMYDKQLINLAAEQSGLSPEFFERADEHRSKGVFSTLVGYLRAPFAGDEGAVNNVLDGDALFKIQSDVIRMLAERESCIFVGRCADYILRDHPRCVNIFITASRAERARRLSEQLTIPTVQAEELMDRADDKRASYYNYYSCGTWGEASTYHLCIDSSVLGVEHTADFILDFVQRKIGENPVY